MEKQVRKLDEIGVKFKTDKSSLLHNYLVEYEKEFPEPEKIEKVVEIGLQRGGKWRTDKVSPSVEMWKEFFPSAHIYGFDIKNLKFKDRRVSFMNGDQGNIHDLNKLSDMIGQVDFILDDGSHESNHQLITFIALWKNLKKGGLYIIEDCNPVVQKDLPERLRIHRLVNYFVFTNDFNIEYRKYVDSKNAGEKSSLIIRKS